MSPDKKHKVKNSMLKKTNVRNEPQKTVQVQCDNDKPLGITPHNAKKNLEASFQNSVGTETDSSLAGDSLGERTMKTKETVHQEMLGIAAGMAGGGGQVTRDSANRSRLDSEEMADDLAATLLTQGVLEHMLEAAKTMNNNSVDVNGNSQPYCGDQCNSVKGFKPQTYKSDSSHYALHQGSHSSFHFYQKINQKETPLASSDSSYLKNFLKKPQTKSAALNKDKRGDFVGMMKPQQDGPNSYDRLEHIVSCSRDLVPSIAPNVYSSQGQIYASIRSAVAQEGREMCGSGHSKTYQRISSPSFGSMCKPGKCFCFGDQVFSPMWERSFPLSSDELYYDCFEPGDYPDKSMVHSSSASSSCCSLRASDQSMSRSSSTSSFKSIPGSPDPPAACSPTAYFSPRETTPILSSAALQSSNKFTFSALPSSPSTPCTTTSSLSSTISPPFGSSRNQQSSMPVMTLFNHSVNFWIMEID